MSGIGSLVSVCPQPSGSRAMSLLLDVLRCGKFSGGDPALDRALAGFDQVGGSYGHGGSWGGAHDGRIQYAT